MRFRGFSTIIASALCVFQCAHVFSTEENFLLINSHSEVVLEIGERLNERFSPCSSFKIALSLMGYEEGILIDEISPVWDYQEGYDDFLETWKSSLTPQSWMKYSCIWYSKVLALKLGIEKIQGYLNSMNYGNMDISGGLSQPGPIEPAWVNSSLKISPREQVDFIHKIIARQEVISPYAIQMTKLILFKEALPEGWKLFGKTGWSGSDIGKDGTLEHSWFVGWIEKDQSIYPFAYLIRDKKIDLSQRIPRVKQLIMESKLMNRHQ